TNVTVSTASRENTLYIPSRAVRTNSEKYVRVLVGSEVKDMPVKLGLKADDGKIEVLSGLQEGDLVVLGIKTK
ncbi:MAG: efflux transporter periplasmic adaptor subunit, partial [Patescibacteria group bacterium]